MVLEQNRDNISLRMELHDDIDFTTLMVQFLYFCKGMGYATPDIERLLEEFGG